MFGSSKEPLVADRFASLRAEVNRLKKMVEEREAEKRAVEEENALRAEVADLRKQLGIAV